MAKRSKKKRRGHYEQQAQRSGKVKDRETEELVAGLTNIIDPPKPTNPIELLSAKQPNPPKVNRAPRPKD